MLASWGYSDVHVHVMFFPVLFFFVITFTLDFDWILFEIEWNALIFYIVFYTNKGGEDPNGFAPSFVEKPRIIPNDAGTLITMKCRCKSKPAPVVTWYREKDVVEETSRIKIKSSTTEEDIYELVLEIKVT